MSYSTVTDVVCVYQNILEQTFSRERGGIVVEFWTQNREVLGLIPTKVIVLCP